MRKILLVTISTASLLGASAWSSASFAASDEACARKEREIEKQLQYAREYNQSNRILGLERALEQVRNNCTSEGLLDDAEREVRKRQAKVLERQEELDQSRAERDSAEKIAKREQKLKEAEDELRQAEADRNSLRP